MNPRLVNVRLDAERARKVRVLREHGIVLSSLVREAIDAEYAALTRAGEPVDASRLIEELFERYPDAPAGAAREYDVHTAREARAAIRKTLSRRTDRR